jgi:opacity protein-like surface antigen
MILHGLAKKMKKIQDRDLPGEQVCACRLVDAAFLLAAACCLSSALPAYAQADLHRAVPPAGRALVFIYRVDREPVAAQVPVVVNREPVGALGNGTFVTATVSPGRTELRIGERLVRTLTFTAAANQSYFVRVQALDARLPVRIDAQPVSETEGRRAIAQSRHLGIAPVVVIPPVAAPPVAAPPVTPPPVAAPPVVAPPPAPPPVVTPPVVAPAPPVEPAVVTEPAAIKPAPEVAAPHEPPRESGFALIASAGTFKLADERQTVAGFPSTYDTTSKSVFSVEGEWRFGSGFAVGGEYFTYKNDLVASTATVPNAQQKVHAFMVNGKYYFHAADWLYPFVGVGVGQATASYSGGLAGDASGLAYQGMAGAEIRLKSVGLYLQYKYLASETGDKGREVKVGGKGVLGGISISF